MTRGGCGGARLDTTSPRRARDAWPIDAEAATAAAVADGDTDSRHIRIDAAGKKSMCTHRKGVSKAATM